MTKLFLAIILFSCAGTLNAAEYASIGSCVDPSAKDESPLRILANSADEKDGLLVTQTPDPSDSSVSLMAAESVTIQKISEIRYEVALSKTSLIGLVSNSFSFSLSKQGEEWKGKHRTFVCKLD
jgi:hypothetical protein